MPTAEVRRTRITGSTRIYGIIGDPVEHSLSPVFWQAAFANLHLNAVYVPFRVKNDEIDRAIAGLQALGVQGVNVTSPHKESAARHCSILHSPADVLQAVNTVWHDDAGKINGANTDACAAQEILSRFPKQRIVTLLGAGGAGKAFLWGLYQTKPDVIYWLNRTQISQVPSFISGDTRIITLPWDDHSLTTAIADSTMIINATPLGWKDDDDLPGLRHGLSADKIYIDLNYAPDSRLVTDARQSGAWVIEGKELLLQQGFESFQILTGYPAPKQVMQKSLSEFFLRDTLPQAIISSTPGKSVTRFAIGTERYTTTNAHHRNGRKDECQ